MTAEWITDDECESIEEQLGPAFVAAQTHLTRVVSLCKRIHDWQERQTKSKVLLGIAGKRDEILGVTNADIKPVSGTAHTVAEGLNAFANYFKHRDEWPHDWTQLERNNEKRTAMIIRAFDASREAREICGRAMKYCSETMTIQISDGSPRPSKCGRAPSESPTRKSFATQGCFEPGSLRLTAAS